MSAAQFDTEEIEDAFRHYWRTGIIGEDWNAWADLFTEDVAYYERILGTMHGRETVRNWIVPLMEQYTGIYGVYEWHTVDPSGRVVFYMQNRRDMPDGSYVDFPGISILQYAGDNRWSMEEDYWAPKPAEETFVAYVKACKANPGFRAKRLRANWGSGPDWTQGPPTYFAHPARA